MERNDDSIDLSRLFQIMGNHKSVIVGIISICTIVAVVISFALPKQYASTTLVQVRSDGSVGATTALAALGAGRLNAPTMSYIELMKTRTVIEPVIDLLEFEEDERPTAEKFAKTYLEITNPKESNLIEVKAIWENPETAQQISKAVVDNFLQMQTDMNQQTQSLLLKFLEKRIVESKEASEVAEEKLLIFSKEHKIYSPDDQVKNVVTQMASYDKAMADFEVSIQSEQASLDAANAALEDQKMNSRIYNISDNEIVQSLRSQIVAKQLELVGLRQSYTEKHPSLQKALGELQQLENSLHSEVVATVDSNVVTLNPAQAEILKKQVLAAVDLSVTKASKKAVEAEWSKKEKELGKLPDEVLEYARLQRNVSIQNEVYLNLVKQSEQSKIKAAMESMDVQIVDPANLPRYDKPIAPHKKLITLLGFLIGCAIALGYGTVLYNRRK